MQNFLKKTLLTVLVAASAVAGCGGGNEPRNETVAAGFISDRAAAKTAAKIAAKTMASEPDQIENSAPTPVSPVDSSIEINRASIHQDSTFASVKTSFDVAPAKMVLAYYSGYSNNYDSLTKYYSNFNAVSIDFWNITSTGIVVGNGDPTPSNAIAFLKSKNIPAYGCISNVDGDWSSAISHSVTSTYRASTIANLVAFAVNNGLAGINIDFENVDQGDRANLNAFSADLASALHAAGMKLIMTVPAFSSVDETNPYNYAFDLAELGKSADFLQIMTYDEAIPAWDPGPVAGSDWMENALDYAVSKAPAAKILNGVPAYGYDWTAPGNGVQLFWRKTAALASRYMVTPTYDIGTNSITFSYRVRNRGARHTVWSENVASVTMKTALVNAYGLGGTSLYALGMEDSNFWSAVRAGLKK